MKIIPDVRREFYGYIVIENKDGIRNSVMKSTHIQNYHPLLIIFSNKGKTMLPLKSIRKLK